MQKNIVKEKEVEAEETLLNKFTEVKKEKIKPISYGEQIKLNNETFEKLSRNEKRIAIAKDVLKWIETGVFRVRKQNGYFSLNESESEYYTTKEALSKSIQSHGCTVCAKGAIFAANFLERGKGVSEWGGIQIDSASSYSDLVSEYFTSMEWSKLEQAFEYNAFGDDTGPESLKLMMKSIIKHKGEIVF